MKPRKQLLKWIILTALFVALLIPFGCEKQSPFQPVYRNKVIRETSQIHFLKSKHPGFAKTFRKDRWITVANGGTITVGDDSSGYSDISFLSGDLDRDTLITFGWDSEGYISELSPHGIEFNNPVALRLSYKDADLSGVVEDSLRIWYYHEGSDVWELIGGTVNKTEKRVEGYINHFSRYAIGDAP
ncbi:MAG TPA: hypothetical protein ENK14_12810 [Caldithrix sp.]|nr:hypothetical protein [Caldithrix sp.]